MKCEECYEEIEGEPVKHMGMNFCPKCARKAGAFWNSPAFHK